jgi:hypothetical protein
VLWPRLHLPSLTQALYWSPLLLLLLLLPPLASLLLWARQRRLPRPRLHPPLLLLRHTARIRGRAPPRSLASTARPSLLSCGIL